MAGERLELKDGDAVSIRRRQQQRQRRRRNHVRVLPHAQVASEDHGAQVEPSREGSVAQGALAQAVQEHREWVKFDNMTQAHGSASLRKRVYCPIPIISLPLLLPWVPEPEFALLAQELELGLSGGASWTLQILQVELRATS